MALEDTLDLDIFSPDPHRLAHQGRRLPAPRRAREKLDTTRFRILRHSGANIRYTSAWSLMKHRSTAALLCLLLATAAPLALAQTFDSKLFSNLRWRSIGPFRGGRTRAGAGVPGQPNVFYIGVVNGGVWKTTDFGRTWKPIFDDQPTGSIGAIAVAPSDPNIIYVGSGEGLQRPDLSVGDGIYKSTDAGKTWTHLGLRDGQQIPANRRRSAQSQPPVRRGARPSLRAQRRARHFPFHRRRPDLREGPLQGRKHRRVRRRDRSRPIPTSSTPRCGKRGKARGRTARGAAPAAASSNPPTAATTGIS